MSLEQRRHGGAPLSGRATLASREENAATRGGRENAPAHVHQARAEGARAAGAARQPTKRRKARPPRAALGAPLAASGAGVVAFGRRLRRRCGRAPRRAETGRRAARFTATPCARRPWTPTGAGAKGGGTPFCTARAYLFSPRGHRRGTARSWPEATRGGAAAGFVPGVNRRGAACRTRSDGSAARGRASRKWGRCAPPSRGARESAANAADSSRPLVSVACPAYQGRRLADGFRWRNCPPVKARPLYLCSPAPCWGMTDSSRTLCYPWRRKPQTGAAPPPPLLDKRTILRHAGTLSDGVCNGIS